MGTVDFMHFVVLRMLDLICAITKGFATVVLLWLLFFV